MLPLALALAGFATLRGLDAPTNAPGYSCGLNASYIFLNRTGHHADYEELAREFAGQPQPDSMLTIKKVLEAHGCATEGVKTDADFFLQNKGPAIVHLQLSGYSYRPENHFSCLVGASRQTGAEVLDPVFNVKAAAHISWLTFSQSYQGAALILK
jgi:ABC-type bacteriocin/lantibiotic exporter with double-glycine peptidase domain